MKLSDLDSVENRRVLWINSYETLGTQEGPGIRFVAFLQGCKWRCLYCHNPETQMQEGGFPETIDRVMERTRRQKPYFRHNGGITISGGEPTLQAESLIALFRMARAEDIHTALDTNGSIVSAEVKELYELTDLVLLDVKHIDPALHRKITGETNAKTLQLLEFRENSGKPVWLRYVLVPGLTDQPEFINEWGKRLCGFRCVERVEILPYRDLARDKYALLGRPYPLENTPLPQTTQVERTRSTLSNYFEKIYVRY